MKPFFGVEPVLMDDKASVLTIYNQDHSLRYIPYSFQGTFVYLASQAPPLQKSAEEEPEYELCLPACNEFSHSYIKVLYFEQAPICWGQMLTWDNNL